MSVHIRRLVSGSKARLKDDELGVELDLAYVTDQIIVMGFPATGLESIYRNRRTDVQRFLTSRHGQDFWVFNFCPITENTYDKSVFQGRVSRYPFPDHHVPPFWYMSLVTKEIHTWLSGSDRRVAVLHCKAGKGRSGMLACAYILASSGSPIVQVTYPPQTLALEDFVPDCNGITEFTSATSNSTKLKEIPPVVNDWSDETDSTREWTVVYPAGFPDTFEQVLELYTTRRMKPAASSVPIYKRKLGVSIPSQQRWLRYWSQFLASGGYPLSKSPRPSSDRMESGPASHIHIPDSGKVRLTRVVVRMRGLSGVQPSLIQAVSLIKQTTNRNDTDANSNGRVWASVARYDDALIDLLENCGEPSRFLASESLCAFKDDKWDRKKMIRRFASITTTDVQVCTDKNTDTQTSTFNMGSPQGWTDVTTECDSLQPESASPSDGSAYSVVSSLSKANSDEIVVHANRELRLKLFWVQATLGWFWFIPAFHISPESTSSTVVFTRSEIDCAVGIGKALVDVEVHLVRCAD